MIISTNDWEQPNGCSQSFISFASPCAAEEESEDGEDAEDPIEDVVGGGKVYCLEFAIPEEMADPVDEEEQAVPDA